MRCYECERFFSRYACAVERGYDECDCPRCQGYCECHLLRAEQHASREEQNQTYIDCGPQAWDDRDSESGDY
jgi:hypothetical protein